MSQQQNQQQAASSTTSIEEQKSSNATSPDGITAMATRTRTAPTKVDRLPPWKVLLHNDDNNEIGYVVETIVELTALDPFEALIHTLEADKTGLTLLMTTHRERAELLCEQFASKFLTVTIEPDR